MWGFLSFFNVDLVLSIETIEPKRTNRIENGVQ